MICLLQQSNCGVSRMLDMIIIHQICVTNQISCFNQNDQFFTPFPKWWFETHMYCTHWNRKYESSFMKSICKMLDVSLMYFSARKWYVPRRSLETIGERTGFRLSWWTRWRYLHILGYCKSPAMFELKLNAQCMIN